MPTDTTWPAKPGLICCLLRCSRLEADRNRTADKTQLRDNFPIFKNGSMNPGDETIGLSHGRIRSIEARMINALLRYIFVQTVHPSGA